MYKTVPLLAVGLLVLTAGCLGSGISAPSATSNPDTSTPAGSTPITPEATPTNTEQTPTITEATQTITEATPTITEATPTITEPTATATPDSRASDPAGGDELLQVSPVDRETAMEFPSSKRATLGELSQERRTVVREALECNCSVEQTAFEFGDRDRIEVVRDGNQWYFLRVVIV